MDKQKGLQQFKIITVTHNRVDINVVGRLHLEETMASARFASAMQVMDLREIMFLSTCNRVEFVVVSQNEIDNEWLTRFYSHLYPDWKKEEVEDVVLFSEVYENRNAVEHLFRVAASLDSLVLGEREIITQVRRAYERSHAAGLTGDLIRLVMRKTIETAKEIFTQTEVATHPVSVVSLAYRALLKLDLPEKIRVVVVGAGETNTTLLRLLKQKWTGEVTVYNRSLSNAEQLASEMKGRAVALDRLPHHKGGFDLLLACTGATDPTVTSKNYTAMLAGESGPKIIVDLGVPADVDREVMMQNDVHRIAVADLKPIAAENLKAREKEMQLCRAIVSKNMREFQQLYQERQVEIAMREIPHQVKAIKEKALQTVFAKELSELDATSRRVLEKVMRYMEKKYISGPMKMAKEIMLRNHND